MSEPKLETEASLFVSDAAHPDASTGAFVFTNRFNLLEFLSSALLVPSLAMDKYYDDISKFAPGRVPLFSASPDGSGELQASRDDDIAFPVAIELDTSRLVLNSAPRVTSSEGVMVWAPSGAIPISCVRRVHFRSTNEAAEHRARKYENIFPDAIPSQVSPQLFAHLVNDTSKITDWLGTLSQPKIAKSTFSNLDREAGALDLLAATLPGIPSILQEFGEILRPDRAGPVAAKLKRGKAPRKSTKTKKPGLTDQAGSRIPQWISTALSPSIPVETSQGLDDLLFATSLGWFRKASIQEKWRPLEALDEIERDVMRGDLSDSGKTEIKKNLDPIRAILRLERDFRPLDTGKGLDVAKSLLMVFLRPDPIKLLSWPAAESGASPTVVQTAAFLAGALSGHKRIPTSLRNHQLDIVLGERTAQQIRDSESAVRDAPLSTVEVSEMDRGSGPTLQLVVQGTAILVKERAKESLNERLLSIDFSKDQLTDAVEIARLLRWNDCVSTTVSYEGQELLVKPAKSGKEGTIVFSGFGSVSVTPILERFRERLGREQIPAELGQGVVAVLSRRDPSDKQ